MNGETKNREFKNREVSNVNYAPFDSGSVGSRNRKLQVDVYTLYRVAQKERNSRYSRFSGLCSNQQLFSSICWIEHLFPIIITSRSSNLVENFLFYETFLMDCHFRDLPDFQSFEAR